MTIAFQQTPSKARGTESGFRDVLGQGLEGSQDHLPLLIACAFLYVYWRDKLNRG